MPIKKYANGDVYEGELKEGKPDGRGRMTCANGNVYKGEWKEGKPDGRGKMTDTDGSVYEWDWKDGLQDGRGKMTYATGLVYEGEWKDGLEDGQGKMTLTDGNVYEGELKKGKPGMVPACGRCCAPSREASARNQVNEPGPEKGFFIRIDKVYKIMPRETTRSSSAGKKRARPA